MIYTEKKNFYQKKPAEVHLNWLFNEVDTFFFFFTCCYLLADFDSYIKPH